MAFQIIRDDITRVHADAIVNTANPHVSYGGGVDAAIYMAAGVDDLLMARGKVGELPAGSVGVTPAFKLSAKYIIHVSSPWWDGGKKEAQDILRSCYDKALMEAYKLNCESIAFPLLATGTYGFPKERALRIAIDSFSRFLEDYEMDIRLVVFDKESLGASEKLFAGLRKFIDDNYVDEALDAEYELDYGTGCVEDSRSSRRKSDNRRPLSSLSSRAAVRAKECAMPLSLETPVMNSFVPDDKMVVPVFADYLQKLINKKGLKNSQVYTKANLTKQYFSKVINGQVNPTKEKLLAIAIALKLNLDELRDMLMMAGYALSPCSKCDLVVEYFIKKNNYDMYEIECMFFELGLPALGSY